MHVQICVPLPVHTPRIFPHGQNPASSIIAMLHMIHGRVLVVELVRHHRMERHSTNFHLCTADDNTIILCCTHADVERTTTVSTGIFPINIGPGFSFPGFGTKTVISLGVDIFDFEFEPIIFFWRNQMSLHFHWSD